MRSSGKQGSQKLKQKTESESSSREPEADREAKIGALERRVKEVEGELAQRDKDLRATVKALEAKDMSLQELAEKIGDLQSRLTENEELLKSRDEQMEGLKAEIDAFVSLIKETKKRKPSLSEFRRLEVELKEKKLELARHESKFWRSMRRRNAWKRSLGWLGYLIPMPGETKEATNSVVGEENGEPAQAVEFTEEIERMASNLSGNLRQLLNVNRPVKG